MKKLFVAIAFISSAYSISAQTNKSYEADGNLKSEKPLSCVDLSSVTNEHTPADILLGMKKCLEAKNYSSAAKLFAIAGVYGRYDSFRVKDKSAHQALVVIQQNMLMDFTDAEKNLLMEAMESELEKGSKNLTENCKAIRKIGPPKYLPKYMIQHGMQAFLNNGEQWLTDGFDSDASWNLSLESYLHCGN